MTSERSKRPTETWTGDVVPFKVNDINAGTKSFSFSAFCVPFGLRREGFLLAIGSNSYSRGRCSGSPTSAIRTKYIHGIDMVVTDGPHNVEWIRLKNN